MSPFRLTLSNYNSLEIPWNRSCLCEFTASGEGRAGAGLTSDPLGAVIAHHLLCLRHHGAAEPIATGARLAAAGVMRIVVEANGAVGTLNVKIFIP